MFLILFRHNKTPKVFCLTFGVHVTHQDLGQLQMYVNYYDRLEKTPEEKPTIGILLCTAKNDTVVRMTLPQDNASILASQYQLYLPTQDQLKNEVEVALRLAEGR